MVLCYDYRVTLFILAPIQIYNVQPALKAISSSNGTLEDQAVASKAISGILLLAILCIVFC